MVPTPNNGVGIMKTGPKERSAEDRFDEIVDKLESGCWLWAGGKVKRYGRIMVGDKTMAAHRFSYMRYKGEIPRGLVVRHKCDVMACVNPDHLELGTHEDNVDDRTARNRHYGHGKKRLDKRRRRAGNRKLTKDDVREIIAEYATGKWTQAQLAWRWCVSQATISASIRGVRNCGSGIGNKRRPGGNFRSKITAEQRDEIRQKYATGSFTQTQLAVEYGVTQARVSDIITGRDYKRSTITPEIPQCPCSRPSKKSI